MRYLWLLFLPVMYDIIDEINDVQLLIETSTRCIQRPEAREKDNNQVKHMQKILPRFESFKRVVCMSLWHYNLLALPSLPFCVRLLFRQH